MKMSSVSASQNATSPSSSNVHEYIREGVNVFNGTVVGSVIGAAICPVGGPELGAAIGGWIGSKLSDPSPSEKR
jgi:hypothetical protein